MKFHSQTKFGQKEGDCFNSCLASIINLHPDQIPFFMAAASWYEELTEWLRGIGYYPMQFEINEPTLENMSHYGVYILSGKSPRSDVPYPGCLHAVLACGDKIIHDPHPSGDNLESYDDLILIVKGIHEQKRKQHKSSQAYYVLAKCIICGLVLSEAFGHRCKGAESKKFNEADYYSADESTEELSETDHLVAIGELIEDICENKSITEVVADISPLTIYGWKRKTLPTDHRIGDDAIDTMLYDFEEQWAEDYGCPFADDFPAWPRDTLSLVKEKLYAAMQECIEKAQIWQCDQNSSMTFSEEELTTLTKKYYPELWDK